MALTKINRFLLLAALIIGAILRLWQLGSLPLGLYHDEAYNGLDALALIEGQTAGQTEGRTFPIYHEAWEHYALDAHAENPPFETRFPLFFEGNYGREPLHVYLMALSIAIFGNTVIAIRIIPALAGILAIWTTYLAAQAIMLELRPHRPSLTAGIAAIAMATIFPAVHFSRFGLRVMVYAPIATLCVAFFWKAIAYTRETNQTSWRYWLTAGVLLGLGFWVYAVGRIFPLLFILFVPIWFWIEPNALRRFWRPIAAMAASSIVVALPLLWFYWQYPYFFFFRIGYVANRGAGTVDGRPWQTWLQNIWRVFFGVFWRGETHFRHNLPGRPLLNEIQTALAGVGTIYTAFKNRRNPAAVFLLLWFLVTLLPSIMSGDAPHFGRMSGSYPVLAILIGIGGDFIWQRFAASEHQRIGTAVLIGLAVISTTQTAYAYFVQYANHPLMGVDFYAEDWEMGLELAQNSDQISNFYFSPTQEQMATILYALGSKRDELRSLNLDQSLIAAGVPQEAARYAIHQRSAAALDQLQTYFPSGEVTAEIGDYTIFYVGPDNAGRPPFPFESPQATVTFASEIELIGWQTELLGNNQFDLTLIWQTITPPQQMLTAFVHLIDPDSGEIICQVDRPPAGYATTDWHANEIISDRFTLICPTDLPLEPPLHLRTGFYDSASLQPLGTPYLFDTPLSP